MALLAFFATNVIGLLAFFAFFLLYLPLCSPAHTSFKRMEPMALANGVIHVHVDMSMEELYADFYKINEAVDALLQAQHAHPLRYNKAMTSLLTDTALAQVTLHDTLQDLWEMPEDTARQRRGIGEAIGKFVGGAFGLATTEDLNTVVDQLNGVSDAYNHVIEILEADETRLAAEAHDIVLLNRSMHLVQSVTGKLKREGTFFAVIAHLRTSQDALQQRLLAAQGAAQHLFEGKASSYLIPRQTAKSLIRRIAARAANEASRSPVASPEDLYQCPTSYSHLTNGWGWAAVIHVPTVPLKEAELYHFVFLGAVAPLPSGELAMIGPEAQAHIALSPDEEDVYIFEPDHLAVACYSMNGLHVCPQDSLLRQPARSTCLGALYLEETTATRAQCALRPLEDRARAVPMGSGQYVLLTKRPTPLALICHGKKINESAVTGFKVIEVPHGCYAKWQESRLHGPVGASVTQIFHTAAINTSNWSFDPPTDDDADALASAKALLSEVKIDLNKTKTHHLEQIQHIKVTATTARDISWPALIASIAAVVLLGAAMLVLVIQFARARRAGRPAGQQV